jgi:hypothetical protein
MTKSYVTGRVVVIHIHRNTQLEYTHLHINNATVGFEQKLIMV